MANSEGVSGVDSYLIYGAETAYNTAVAATIQFGLVTNFSPSTTNNNTYRRGFTGGGQSGRDVIKVLPGKAEHSLSFDFDVINWLFMEHVLGTAAGSDPYTYSGSDATKSITVVRAIDNPGGSATDRDEIWSGCVFDSITIKAAVGEPVSVSANVKAGHHSFDETIQSKVSLGTPSVYNFTGGSIELPNASSMSNIIDSVEITITNNYEMLYGLGDRRPLNARPKSRDYKIKFSLKYLDNTYLQAILGLAIPIATTTPTEYATIELNFVDGDRSAAFLFTKFTFDELSGKESLNEMIGEDFGGTANTLVVTEDNT